jgi:hypothetical protein
MRNLANFAMAALMWVVLATMVYAIYSVLAQPMVYGDEKPILKQEILKPGYMPDPVERPQIDSKRFTRSEGYLYDPNTGTTRHVELRGYSYGNQTFYTGRIGRANIQVEPGVRGSLKSQRKD